VFLDRISKFSHKKEVDETTICLIDLASNRKGGLGWLYTDNPDRIELRIGIASVKHDDLPAVGGHGVPRVNSVSS